MSFSLKVEWMDGEERRYECGSDAYTENKDGVLRLMDPPYYGSKAVVKTSLPIANIREFRWEGR